ncbi:unnamed protein product [Trichogramma brassicae]|uniref:BTB domain-containing protein n=1 Tax=Trichogramma brassicae TaxID=86971 RepID=A0A6H5IT45_9HYME|nr:unnamed protein product [Trichogramma brassicae]
MQRPSANDKFRNAQFPDSARANSFEGHVPHDDATRPMDVDPSGEPQGETMTFVKETFASEVMKVMYTMRNNRMLTDVALEVGDKVLWAHKIVLAASSSYFTAMFTGGLKETNMARVKLEGVCPTSVDQLIHFMYTGEVGVSEKSVCTLLCAAMMLQEMTSTRHSLERLDSTFCLDTTSISLKNPQEELKHLQRKLKSVNSGNDDILDALSRISEIVKSSPCHATTSLMATSTAKPMRPAGSAAPPYGRIFRARSLRTASRTGQARAGRAGQELSQVRGGPRGCDQGTVGADQQRVVQAVPANTDLGPGERAQESGGAGRLRGGRQGPVDGRPSCEGSALGWPCGRRLSQIGLSYGGQVPDRWQFRYQAIPLDDKKLGGATPSEGRRDFQAHATDQRRHKFHHRDSSGTVGIPLPGVEVRLTEPETPENPKPKVLLYGNSKKSKAVEEVKEPVSGDLQVKGENVFKHYWQRPEVTEKSFTDDGWFKTAQSIIVCENCPAIRDALHTAFLCSKHKHKHGKIQVVLVIGLHGCLRSAELLAMQIQDVKEEGKLYHINVPETKTGISKSFVTSAEVHPLITNYIKLRPKEMDRFFLQFRNETCTRQTVHGGHKDFACDQCEKKFGQRVTLLTHQKVVHEGHKDYACDKCEQKFAREVGLLLHQKIVHEGRKDFECDKCDKKFTLKSSLLTHLKIIHEGRKDYTCDKCEKKFGHKTHLLNHQKTVHERRKDYACDWCEKKFGYKWILLTHLKTIHEGRKDYACDKCEKKFGHKSSLLTHQKIVHEGQKNQYFTLIYIPMRYTSM